VKRLVDKAQGYGAAADRADGNDVLAVYEVTKRAVDRARAGGGVTLIELHTYRRKGHAEHDDQSYVPAEELAYWEARDPIDRYERLLDETGWVSREERAVLRGRIDAVLDAAITTALDEPFPEPASALEGIYAEPATCAPLWYKD